MKRTAHRSQLFACALLLLQLSHPLSGEPTSAALGAFRAYTQGVELRLDRQHGQTGNFLAWPDPDHRAGTEQRLRHGELVLERLTPANGAEASDALLHHWRGTAFAPGAHAADFQRLIRAFNAYPQHFAPEVVSAKVLGGSGDRLQTFMRVRQHHVITVVMDTDYDVRFGQLDPRHGYTISRSTRIAEIDSPGTRNERALGPDEEHGFLYRLNSYWSYEERDGGLYLQLEAVSLTRSVPRGLGWAVRPYIESIPRESLEFTLRSACNALHK